MLENNQNQNQNPIDNQQPAVNQQGYSSGPIAQQNLLPEETYGPRPISLFTVFAKTFLGICGGMFGSLILLLIFLAASSVLQPVLSPADATNESVNPIFIVILMAMIFATSLISSILTPWLLSYTERLRYPRIVTAIYQIFIMNLIVFAFTAPIYLTTSTTSLCNTASRRRSRRPQGCSISLSPHRARIAACWTWSLCQVL
jgi:uncharacterized membrane protein